MDNRKCTEPHFARAWHIYLAPWHNRNTDVCVYIKLLALIISQTIGLVQCESICIK